MFKLTEDELQHGFEAVEHHGFSALLPTPLEWETVRVNWADIRTELSDMDLDTFSPAAPLRVYAPKSRATVRMVSLLHPIDLLIYTSLTLIVKDDIERRRIPRRKKTVFSYRSPIGTPNRLYDTEGLFKEYQSRLNVLSARSSVRFVAIADIADFFPRLNQHRLENVIETSASDDRGRNVARVLVKKFISKISGKNSYGIPVGPYASRILAEAVLIDVDSFLESQKYEFVRWVDDFYVFTRTEEQAQTVLISLAEHLYEHHGLTLSALKTKIQAVDNFRRRFDDEPRKVVDERLSKFLEFSSRVDPYSDEEEILSDEEVAELAELNLVELVEKSIEDKELVDYDTISALLRHPDLLVILPKDARYKLACLLLKHIGLLYPVAEDLALFLGSLIDLPARRMLSIKGKILKSIQPSRGKWPPDYYILWILSIFSRGSEWGESPVFARVFHDHRIEIVRRSAALAIATNGTRADAIVVKGEFSAVYPVCRLAILLASRKLGQDERHHWRTGLQLSGPLERKI